MRRERVRLVTVAAVAAVVLGVVSTFALAALSGAFTTSGSLAGPYPWASPRSPFGQSAGCDVPALPGSVVDVGVTEMGAMMGGPDQRGPGTGGWYPDGGNGGQPWPRGMGWMDMTISPGQVKAGEVSMRVTNRGWRPHEMVVLPLAQGQGVGQRPIGANGKVDESGALGEASAGCTAGSGEGIAPGATGWTTVALQPGRYELVCNFLGHYRAGMYAELDVTP